MKNTTTTTTKRRAWVPALAALGLALGATSSCSKFLEVAPQGQPLTTQFF